MPHPPGLTTSEATRRLAEVGPNALPEQAPEPAWRRFLRQFRSPLIYILLFAVVVDVGVWWIAHGDGWPFEAVAIAVILVLNAGLGVWQERKAEQALARLKQLAAPQVWTIRDGEIVRLDAARLVPGDVVRLEAGDRVPADAAASEPQNLLVDESIVTGESVPIEKAAGEPLLAGTLAVRGKAWIEITETGARSTMGRLATMLSDVRAEPTPLERRLSTFGHRVARWVIALAVVIGVGGVLAEGIGSAGQVLVFAVALAVAAVPEGLPAVLAVTLALGVERMAARRAVVRKLAAVEALGSVTVIATDKTGTLTENLMEVRELDVVDREQALAAMVLANEAEPDTGAGDPLELALLAHAAGAGVDATALRGAFRRTSGRPFDSEWKYTRITGERDGRTLTYMKGAPEVVLGCCALDASERGTWSARLDAHAAAGFRMLALAWAEGTAEEGLTWLGLVLLWDPPRAEVPDAVAQAQAAGIRIVMITGDHPATARAVAGTIGIAGDGVMTGAEVAGLSPDALRTAVRDTAVFARVDPEHKLRLVEALKANGEIVAMTGDGVNDAPALKRADVGIAMGQRGSDVSREVADLVLLDDNFATIVAAIEEGRSIYENIQKFIRFLFSTNLSEVLVVAIGAFAAFWLDLRDATGALLLPLTAAQLLWINLATDGAPALALGLDRNPGVMGHRPRTASEPLLDRRSLEFILITGGAKALLAGALLGLLPRLAAEPLDATRTATFLFMALGQLVFAYPARHTDVLPPPNRVLHWAVGLTALAQLAVLWTPGLREAFDMVVPSGGAALSIVLAVALAWAFAETTTRLLWSGKQPPIPGRPPST